MTKYSNELNILFQIFLFFFSKIKIIKSEYNKKKITIQQYIFENLFFSIIMKLILLNFIKFKNKIVIKIIRIIL
jgi:hypothetical protein